MTELHELHRIPEDAHYVLGFVFNSTLTDVLLVLKARPAWQADWLNGIGGRIEAGEDPRTAMSRTCRKECGLSVDPQAWHPLAAYYRPGTFLVHCYHVASPAIGEAKTVSDEPVVRQKVADLMKLKVLPSVRWLVHLALDPGVVNKVLVQEQPRAIEKEAGT